MTPFLKQVADHYHRQGDIQKNCFIFPNRRSMIFFRKYLGETIDTPIVLPEMLTINDFVYRTAGAVQTDRVALLLVLYDCYKALNPSAEPLDEFIFWGDTILADFNDVDKYLVNPKQLFANVADFKNIQDDFSYLTDDQRRAIEAFVSHFNDASGKLTVDLNSDNPDVKARFLQIWNILYRLYLDYNACLSEKGMAYEGMVYRSLAERLRGEEDISDGIFPADMRFVFVGLNALNECEKALLRSLRTASRADFCWDYSGRLIKDPRNRSSVFMSENVREFKPVSFCLDEQDSVPEINVIHVPSSVGLAKRLPDILKDHSDDCAVVLPDEGLLTSVLNSIPEDIEDINVTMGLPMSGSVFYAMMNDISSLQMHAVHRGGQWCFYHKTVWNLCANALFRCALDEESDDIISQARADSMSYIPQSRLNGTPLLDAVFRVAVEELKARSSAQTLRLAEYQKSVIRAVAPSVSEDPKMALELEFAKEYYKCINILQSHVLEVLPMTYFRLLSQLLGGVSVPFRGEPLKGLQIMGPLELRALDFRHLVIMSADEGVFPRKSVSSSFIPPQLRKGFGLPTYEYQDAVWAYYFYRAISRAQKVWMLVDTRTEGVNTGEESRYIRQLEYHFGVPVNRYTVRYADMRIVPQPEIVKTQEDIEAIKSATLSASSIKNYLACKARFYYSVVRRLRPENEVQESLDAKMLGTVYHDLMRSLYTSRDAMSPGYVFDTAEEKNGLLDQPVYISRAYIDEWIGRPEDIKAKVRSLVMAQLKNDAIQGRNLVIVDVIVRYALETLKRDLEQLDKCGRDGFNVLGLEVQLRSEIDGQRIKGVIDRLDDLPGGQVRVVDYKTGEVLTDDEEINEKNAVKVAGKIFDIEAKKRPDIAFQFYVYDRLLRDKGLFPDRELFNSVYSIAKIFKEAPKTRAVNETFYSEVTRLLGELLAEMYDPDVPFARTSVTDTCKYCDFKNICGR